jgi:hypothetical protein
MKEIKLASLVMITMFLGWIADLALELSYSHPLFGYGLMAICVLAFCYIFGFWIFTSIKNLRKKRVERI